MSALPQGWTLTKFTDVFDIQGGTQPPKSTFQYEPQAGYVKLLQIRDFGKRPVPTYVRDTNTLKKCTEQDILIARYGASLGRVLTGLSGAYNVAMAKLDIPEEVYKRFVYHLLTSGIFQAPLRLVSRSAQSGFNKQDLAKIEIPIVPLNEQKRIADKLDTLLTRVDACRDRLERVPRILKYFRQSILNAAAAGELTKNWRGNLQENETEDLDHLPINWQIYVLTEIAEVIDPNPKHRNPKYFQSGFPFLSTAQFGEIDGWNLTQVKYVNEETVLEQESRCDFRDVSLAFSRKGTIGKVRKLPTDIRFALLDSVCVINPLDNQNSDYLKIALEAKFVQEQISRLTRGVALKQVSVGDVRSLQIPLPSLDEQHEIVRRVRVLFTFADGCEVRYQKALRRVEQLTPVLLEKAFRGELVPQDPNEEPATVLLERIRAKQLTKPKRVLTDRKPNMTKMTKESVKEVIHQMPKDAFSFDELTEKLSGDYDSLKDILFTLLSEAEPSIMQVFNQEAEAMCFIRGNK